MPLYYVPQAIQFKENHTIKCEMYKHITSSITTSYNSKIKLKFKDVIKEKLIYLKMSNHQWWCICKYSITWCAGGSDSLLGPCGKFCACAECNNWSSGSDTHSYTDCGVCQHTYVCVFERPTPSMHTYLFLL